MVFLSRSLTERISSFSNSSNAFRYERSVIWIFSYVAKSTRTLVVLAYSPRILPDLKKGHISSSGFRNHSAIWSLKRRYAGRTRFIRKNNDLTYNWPRTFQNTLDLSSDRFDTWDTVILDSVGWSDLENAGQRHSTGWISSCQSTEVTQLRWSDGRITLYWSQKTLWVSSTVWLSQVLEYSFEIPHHHRRKWSSVYFPLNRLLLQQVGRSPSPSALIMETRCPYFTFIAVKNISLANPEFPGSTCLHWITHPIKFPRTHKC